MADVNLSSILGGGGAGGIESRNLNNGVVFTRLGLIADDAGSTSANSWTNVITVVGSGWLLAVVLRNAYTTNNPPTNRFRGSLTIDGVVVADQESPNSSSANDALFFIGAPSAIGSTTASVSGYTPVRFNTGFSFDIRSTQLRVSTQNMGYFVRYFLD